MTNNKDDKNKNIRIDNVVISKQYPLSQLYPFKKSTIWFLFVFFALGLYFWGGETFRVVAGNLLVSLGSDKPIFYPILCIILLCSVLYWYAFIFTFEYGISKGILYITRGVFVRNTFDYPITSLENTAITRDFLDMLFGLCSINLMTANDDSDDIAAIHGLKNKDGLLLHEMLRTLMDDYQSSRYDINDLREQIESATQK